MSIWWIAAAGIASMTAAMERGDLDEAARQGALAGPAVVERALASTHRTTVLAGIAAAPSTEDRAELLPSLATLAAGADRRTAIPAARAAARIASELARRELVGELPDDLAPDDLAGWAEAWHALALRRDRWIEVRVDALAITAALTGAVDPAALADPDPALRGAAIGLVPSPVPAEARAPLAALVTSDATPRLALAAAQALCAELASGPAAPALAALGAPGIAAIRVLVVDPAAALPAVRDAARCLAADTAPESATTLAKIAKRL